MKALAVFLLLPIAAAAADKPRTWTAMSVYSDGKLSIQDGINSEGICREALCMVKDKMTCAERAAADERAAQKAKADREEYEKKKVAFRIDHPCTTKNEDWGKDDAGKAIKKLVKHCATPDGGDEVFDTDGRLIMGNLGWNTMAVFTTGSSSYVVKQACFQE